jgi:hypothetical protein
MVVVSPSLTTKHIMTPSGLVSTQGSAKTRSNPAIASKSFKQIMKEMQQNASTSQDWPVNPNWGNSLTKGGAGLRAPQLMIGNKPTIKELKQQLFYMRPQSA